MIILFIVFCLNLLLNVNNEYITFENLINDLNTFGIYTSNSWLMYIVSTSYSIIFVWLIYGFKKLNKIEIYKFTFYNYSIFFTTNFISIAFVIFLLRITNYSRLLYLIYLIIVPVIILYIKSIQKSSLNVFSYIFAGFLLFFAISSTESLNNAVDINSLTDDFQDQSSIDVSDCRLFESSSVDNNKEILNSFYIVGHAYGKPGGTNIGLSENLLDYFSNLSIEDGEFLVLTGDFNRDNTLEDLQQSKIQIEKYFDKYFVVPGNHEVRENNNFYEVYKNDFFYVELENTLLIGASFNNSDWLPTIYSQNLINEIISKSSSKTILLFSHQLFWKDLFENKVTPNSSQFLKKLDPEPIDWIKTKDKKLIVISGDYGAFGASTFCKKYKEITFIANGIGGLETDTVIKIFETKEELFFKEIKLKE